MKANQHSIEPLSHSVIEDVIFVEKPKKNKSKQTYLQMGIKCAENVNMQQKKKQ